ncbi:hypothetical protein BKA69DRAFT_849808 [Paraphysoderma sedebokerense]|nr:hypothetical protein BKA69DRAFT_849808 [Paraphysoderma sedebokerense]
MDRERELESGEKKGVDADGDVKMDSHEEKTSEALRTADQTSTPEETESAHHPSHDDHMEVETANATQNGKASQQPGTDTSNVDPSPRNKDSPRRPK